MIKINLLGDDTVVDHSGRLVVILMAGSIVICLGVFVLLYNSISSSVAAVQDEVAALDVELNKLKETTKEVRDLEAKRAGLRDKLIVIATLKRNKTGPVRVMDDLNKALPERSWIEELREQDGQLRISGKALDNQTIASFMKDLETSEFYETVDLGETKQSDWKGVKIKDFTLQARINYAGEIKAQVPAEVADPSTTPAAEPQQGQG
ncbi:MAG: hypothetical protein DCC75_00915 [Proteobacteria bacterium]|nr:MAG: hypothetical protein DCC75_00915 [Pseudomonadota bacterium]